MLMPKLSHHTHRLVIPNTEFPEANVTPLSVRMALGSPKSLKALSKTEKATSDLVD